MINLGTCKFKDLNIGIITPGEYSMNSFIEKVFKLEHIHTSTKMLCIILDDKYEKAHLNKVLKNECQNLLEKQRIK